MQWLQYLLRGFPLIPQIVIGIEQLHGDAKSGADKKQLAMEALGFAANTAGSVVAPELQPAVAAAASLASTAIDGVVAVMNAGTQAASTTNPTAKVFQNPNSKGKAL